MLQNMITFDVFVFLSALFRAGSSAPIVNGIGKPIEPGLGAFPFHASLMQLIRDRKVYHSFCGGSLIHPQWVLTAAHCIQIDESVQPLQPFQVYVALGSIYRNAKGAQIIRTKQLIIHPSYLVTDLSDIGLVKLASPAKLGRNVNIVFLHANNKESLLNRTAYLTGFGIINDLYETPDRLRKAVLHISDNNKCFNSNKNDNIEICATSKVVEGKACKGDSGGPLVIQQKGKWMQIGITSHLSLLPFCRLSFNHSVYTKVAAYVDWISKITRILFF